MPNTDRNKYRLEFIGEREAHNFQIARTSAFTRLNALREIRDKKKKGLPLAEDVLFSGRKISKRHREVLQQLADNLAEIEDFELGMKAAIIWKENQSDKSDSAPVRR